MTEFVRRKNVTPSQERTRAILDEIEGGALVSLQSDEALSVSEGWVSGEDVVRISVAAYAGEDEAGLKMVEARATGAAILLRSLLRARGLEAEIDERLTIRSRKNANSDGWHRHGQRGSVTVFVLASDPALAGRPAEEVAS